MRAEETLASIQAQVAANGSLAKTDLAKYLRELKKDAQGGRRRKAAKAASPKQLASMGIKTEGG